MGMTRAPILLPLLFLLLSSLSAQVECASYITLLHHDTPTSSNVCDIISNSVREGKKTEYLGSYDGVALLHSYSDAEEEDQDERRICIYDASRYTYYVLQREDKDGDEESGIPLLLLAHWQEEKVATAYELGMDVFFLTQRSILIQVEKKKREEDEMLFFRRMVDERSAVMAVMPKNVTCAVQEDRDAHFLKLSAKHAADADPLIVDLVSKVNEEDMRSFLEYLTGEAAGSPILTRNSMSGGAVLASKWIQTQLEGFGFTTSFQSFRSNYSDNVIGVWPASSSSKSIIVVGAHYDSRSADVSSPTARAPGANDDGSGTSALLTIAKVLSQSRLKLTHAVYVVFFGGEEQGLVGSAACAKWLADSRADVIAMLQSDMIAYRRAGSSPLLGFPRTYTTDSLTNLAITAANTYAPGVATGRNDRCCSDHKSFFDVGFSVTDFSDTHGPIVDPMYHNVGDVVNRPGFDFEQLTLITKALLATLLTVAEPVV